ncbi:hypothetical protein HDU91_000803 [Kappamyces sp. JEL0680]|nr:hypothetical protein HDU91_000803 [Kappamyces sp. JEL0680]
MQLRQTHRGHIGVQAKARERAHPKLGRLDIDYQKLHDAFFRFQTKPMFSTHGDVYFEGREFDTGLRTKKPGILSDDLKIALNIPAGAPPPWLINMQRYGPPPSYPHLQIPGLNAPIPEGAQWGFHPGGWGKPPTDEYNRPLYGDVFASSKPVIPDEVCKRTLISLVYGPNGRICVGRIRGNSAPTDLRQEEEYESEEEEEEEEEAAEEEEEEEEEAEEPVQESVQFETGAIDIETEHIELRKEDKKYDQGTSKSKNGEFMGSSHTYSIPGKAGEVQVALNPDDLDMDPETLKRKFDEGVQQNAKNGAAKEDHLDTANEPVDRHSKRSRREKKDFKF